MKAATVGLVALLAAQPDSIPNISDLKITTRRTSDGYASTDTVYFKAARQRHDSITEIHGTNHLWTTLFDCHDRRQTMLNHEAHTYAAVPIETVRERIARARRTGQATWLPEATGPEVTTTVDAVDTGERRRHGRYTARHVITTITVDAAPGASTQSGTQKRDGWYIDLPDGGCEVPDGSSFAQLRGHVVRAGQPQPPLDRERVQFLGRARRGLALEETNGPMKIELVDFSEARLDDALFTVPSDYRPALVTPHGGFDMTKPDSLLNRVELYCEVWAAWVRSVFR